MEIDIATLIGVVATMIVAYLGYRGTSISAADEVVNAARAMMDEYRKEAERVALRLNGEIDKLRVRIEALEKGNKELTDRLKREAARSAFLRAGAWQLYHQVKRLKELPVFDPGKEDDEQ